MLIGKLKDSMEVFLVVRRSRLFIQAKEGFLEWEGIKTGFLWSSATVKEARERWQQRKHEKAPKQILASVLVNCSPTVEHPI